MVKQMMRCLRCKGRKKMFKIGSAYSHLDTGGKEIKCPMCLGEGKVKTLENVIADFKEINAPKEVIADVKEINQVKKRKYVRKNIN